MRQGQAAKRVMGRRGRTLVQFNITDVSNIGPTASGEVPGPFLFVAGLVLVFSRCYVEQAAIQ